MGRIWISALVLSLYSSVAFSASDYQFSVINNGFTHWSLTSVSSTDVYAGTLPTDDPLIILIIGKRYAITNPVFGPHPFQLIAKSGDGFSDLVLLSGGAINGASETDSGIAWTDNGNGVTEFTVTSSLATVMNDSGRIPGYRCGVHTTMMRGNFSISGGAAATATFTAVPTATATNTPVPVATSTPTVSGDTDGDGIPNGLEDGKSPAAGKTNAYLPDSDGDGLSDGTEDANHNGVANEAGETNPRVKDTDGDQYVDGLEVILGSNPLNTASPATAFADADTDELNDNNDPNTSNADTDNDRFKDGYEAAVLGLAAANNVSQKPTLGDVDQNNVLDNADSQHILNFFGGTTGVNFNGGRADVDRNAFIDNADSQQSLNFFGSVAPYLPIH